MTNLPWRSGNVNAAMVAAQHKKKQGGQFTGPELAKSNSIFSLKNEPGGGSEATDAGIPFFLDF